MLRSDERLFFGFQAGGGQHHAKGAEVASSLEGLMNHE